MRILSTHLTPLDHQVQESANILKAMIHPQECLNRKSEWGGAKIPGIVVQTPKGVVSEKFGKEEKEENDNETQRCAEILEKAGKKGQKRV